MADGPATQEGGENAAASKSKLPLILLTALICLLLGGGGVFIYTKLLAPPPAIEPVAQPTPPAKPADGLGEMYPMEPFTVNLADPKGKRYIKIKIELELESPTARERLDKATPKLRDAVIVMLTSLSFEEVMTPEGKIRIRDELLVRFNQAVKPERIKNIYFTDFLVQ